MIQPNTLAVHDKSEIVTMTSVSKTHGDYIDSNGDRRTSPLEYFDECLLVTILPSGKAREVNEQHRPPNKYFAYFGTEKKLNPIWIAWRESEDLLKELPYKLINDSPWKEPLFNQYYAFINEEQVFVLVKPVDK